MCYDISFTVNVPQLSDYFREMKFDEQLSFDFEGTHILGHAYGAHPIIYRERESSELHCRAMEWGCIPYYIDDEDKFKKQRSTMLVARSERVLLDLASYWFKIRNRRCLIPVSGFFEHRGIRGWKKKVPYFISLKNQSLFFIPGLYSVAELGNKETGELTKRWTFSLITREANKVMRQIHNEGEHKGRMPLMLPLERSLEFLNKDLSPAHYQEILDFEMPSEELNYHPVYTIRSAKQRPDDAPKTAPWNWEQLPALGELEPE